MSSLLRAGRILSSDENNTIKQEQHLDVNVNIKQNQPNQKSNEGLNSPGQSLSQPQNNSYIHPQASYSGTAGNNVAYPNINQGISSHPSNFTLPPMVDASQYPSAVATNSPIHPDVSNLENANQLLRTEFENEIADLKIRNEFLELLLNAFQANPIRINSYVIVNHTLLIQMIKLLTGASKVDILIDEDLGCDCSGCCADVNNDEIYYIQKILVSKDGQTTELKYSHNNVYAEFIKLGISLKICSR